MLYRLFLLAVLLSLPVHSLALALGDVVVRSALGQVLDADIDMVVLSAQEAESLLVMVYVMLLIHVSAVVSPRRSARNLLPLRS